MAVDGPFSSDDGYVATLGERAWSASDVAWRETHIFPIPDMYLHEFSDECLCGVRVEVVLIQSAAPWVVVHHLAVWSE